MQVIYIQLLFKSPTFITDPTILLNIRKTQLLQLSFFVLQETVNINIYE